MGQSPSSSAPSSPSSVRKAKSPSNQRVKARISARFNELAVARPPLETVERGLLIEVLSCPGAEDFGELLLGVHKEDINDLKESDYVHAICEALGLEVEDGSSTTTESRLTFYFSVFCVSRLDNIIDQKRFLKMLRYACVLGLASGTAASVAVPEDHPTILALMQSAMKNVRDKEAITITEFVDWASTTCPDLFSGIVRWVELQGLAEGSEGDLWATDHHLPSFDEGKADKKLLDYVSLWALSTALPPLYKKSTMWTLLYTSNENGLSFNRFQHHVGHYDGPTVLIFHTDCDALFGACVDMEWKETESARGRDNCHLFAIQPQFHFEHNGIKFYENEKTRHQDHGIGFGSDANHRGTADLWIENDLTKCTVRFAPVVQRGSSKEFKIRSIEVWGCADPDVAAKQHSERVRDRTMAELRQRVKRPTNVETDRYLLDLAGVNTSQAQAQIDITAEKATSKLSTNTEFVPGSL